MDTRTVLLGGQTTVLGIMLAFLVVPSSALFLHSYGAANLPYAYLTVALAGVLVSYGLTRLQRRWSLGRVALVVLGGYVAIVVAAWLALVTADARWVTFGLIVLFPLAIPTGFLVVGAQAVRLYDVRGLKAHFPRIAAGFSLGFAIGGLAAGLLVAPLGGPTPLLAIGAVAALGMIAVIGLTLRAYPHELLAPPAPPARPPASRDRSRAGASWRSGLAVLRDPLVLLVLGYQVLSSAVTQLVDFMVWDRAVANYPDPSALAQFQGYFGTVINVVSLLFVILLASLLMTRYGVRFGLLANPVAVLAALAVAAVIGQLSGPVGFGFLAVVCAVQVIDISTTDGLTRTSIAATYQAVPFATRLRAQTVVEGAGVPLAVGFVGLLLIGRNAIGADIMVVGLVTLVLALAWVGFAVAAHRQYGSHLSSVLATRSWDPVALRLDDPAARAAVAQLLASRDPRDRATGLDALLDGAAPELATELARALGEPDAEIRAVGLDALGRAGSEIDTDPRVRARLDALLADPDPGLAAGASVLVAAHPGPGADEALARWRDAVRSDGPATTAAALRAAARRPSPRLVEVLLELADRPVPPAELPAALAAAGGLLTPGLAGLLAREGSRSGSAGPSARRELVVRAVGRSGDPAGRALLLEHLARCGRSDVALVAEALAAAPAGTRRGGRSARELLGVVVRAEAERMAAVLARLDALDETPGDATSGASVLAAALRDDLARSQHHVGLLLCVVGPSEGPERVIAALAGDDEASRNTAIELIEVSAGPSLTPVVLAVLDPRYSAAERLEALRRLLPVHRPVPHDWLADLALDPKGTWADPWLRAVALRALPEIAPELRSAVRAALDDPDPVVRETAIWLEAGSPVG